MHACVLMDDGMMNVCEGFWRLHALSENMVLAVEALDDAFRNCRESTSPRR